MEKILVEVKLGAECLISSFGSALPKGTLGQKGQQAQVGTGDVLAAWRGKNCHGGGQTLEADPGERETSPLLETFRTCWQSLEHCVSSRMLG